MHIITTYISSGPPLARAADVAPASSGPRADGAAASPAAAPAAAPAPFCSALATPVDLPPALACFIDSAHRTFLDRPATDGEIATYMAAFASGTPRSDLPRILANSDEWLSVQVTRLYDMVLDRVPEPAGLAYWVGRLRNGDSVPRVAALIYSSAEHYDNAGGTDADFVTGLYQRILGRTPSPSDITFWTGKVAESGRARVSGLVFGAPESRGARVDALDADLLDRPAEPGGREFWIDRLTTVTDVHLAIEIASSPEFYDRSLKTCTLHEVT